MSSIQKLAVVQKQDCLRDKGELLCQTLVLLAQVLGPHADVRRVIGHLDGLAIAKPRCAWAAS
jgi:hypothetical protein